MLAGEPLRTAASERTGQEVVEDRSNELGVGAKAAVRGSVWNHGATLRSDPPLVHRKRAGRAGEKSRLSGCFAILLAKKLTFRVELRILL